MGGGAFPTVLRSAIRARGLTLERLRVRLGERGHRVGLSTLSGWQHGRARPSSPQVVRVLEDILELPRGTLTALVPRAALAERAGALGELLAHFPGSREHTVDVLTRHDTVTVGADRRTARLWTREVLRARRDGVDRILVRYFGDEGCDIDRVVLDGLENCLVGEVRRHPVEPVMVAELHFGQALRAGETWVLERALTDGTGGVGTEYACTVRRRVDQYLLQVRFDPAALPAACLSFAQTDLYEPRRETARLPLNTHHAAHLSVSGLLGGLVGVAWRWE